MKIRRAFLSLLFAALSSVGSAGTVVSEGVTSAMEELWQRIGVSAAVGLVIAMIVSLALPAVVSAWRRLLFAVRGAPLRAVLLFAFSFAMVAYGGTKKFVVQFDRNGSDVSGTMPAQEIAFDQREALVSNAFTRVNFTFEGWSRTADGMVDFADGAIVSNLSFDTTADGATNTLYANWKAVETPPKEDEPEQEDPPPEQEDPPHEDPPQEQEDPPHEDPPPEDQPTNTVFFVAFDPNGGVGTVITQKFVKGEAQALKKNSFSFAEHIFGGWATNETGVAEYTDEQLLTDSFAGESDVLTLYAYWIADYTGEDRWEYINIEGDEDNVIIESPYKEVQVSAIKPATSGDVVIPSVVMNYRVVSIGCQAFSGCSLVTSVVIPEGVTNIAERAFEGCVALTNVVFPSSMKSIGKNAFAGCDRLHDIRISAANITIDEDAFLDCDGLVEIMLKGDKVVFGARSFGGCDKLVNLVVEASEVLFERDSFSDSTRYGSCASLENISVSSRMATFGDGSFKGCGQLHSLRLAVRDKVTIGGSAFRSCSGLTSLQFCGMNSVDIGEAAFSGCSGIDRVVFEQIHDVSVGESAFSYSATAGSLSFGELRLGVTNLTVAASGFANNTALTNLVFDGETLSLGDSCFSGCGALTNVDFAAATVLSMGANALTSCSSLKTVALSAGSALTVGGSAFVSCSALEQVSLSAKEGLSVGEKAFNADAGLKAVTLTCDGPSTIGNATFQSCSSLECAIMPVGLTGVSSSAFERCVSLKEIDLSTNVTTVAGRAFLGCSDLERVGLSNGLLDIDEMAFYECTGLKGLVVSQTVAHLGKHAFSGCSGMATLRFAEGDTNVVAASELRIEDRAFYLCTGLKEVALSQNVVEMKRQAFAQCTSLASVALPTNLEIVAERLFESCVSLPTIELPPNLREIGNSAFYKCEALDGFLVPTNNLVTIDKEAFTYTKYWNDWPDNGIVFNNGYILGVKGTLKEVVLPEGCRSIPAEMFADMVSLESVVMPAGVAKIGFRAFANSGVRSIVIADAAEIETAAFSGCSNLVQAVLSDELKSLPECLFEDCISLEAIDIPDSVETIGSSAFRNCRSLETVTGGAGVVEIGDYAFAGDVRLAPFAFANDVKYGVHVFQGVQWTENVLVPSVGTMKDEYPESYAHIRSVVISTDCTNIVDRLFEGCASLENVVIPAGVTSIGVNAFAGCPKITSATLPIVGKLKEIFPESYSKMEVVIATDSTTIAEEGFVGLDQLTKVVIPPSVETIGARAFYGCGSLAEVVVSGGVTEIGELAFGNCVNLRTVAYLGEMPTVESNIYQGTVGYMCSRVLRIYESWSEVDEASSNSVARLPVKWPEGEDARPIGWLKTDNYMVRVRYYDGYSHLIGETWHAKGAVVDLTPAEEPEREGYVFLGWSTDKNGDEVLSDEDLQEFAVTDEMTFLNFYARWEPEDEDDDLEGEEYDFTASQVYDGVLMSAGAIIGTVQFKMQKGWRDHDTGEMVTSVSVSATINGKKKTGKGAIYEDGTMEIRGLGVDEPIEFVIDAEGVEGMVGEYDVVASRSVFASKDAEDKAFAKETLKVAKGNYTVALSAEATDEWPYSGYLPVSVSVSSSGKVKATATLPNGTKLSASASLMWMDEMLVVPLSFGGSRKESFGFLLNLSEDAYGVESLGNLTDSSGELIAMLDVVRVGRAMKCEETEAMFSIEPLDFDLGDEMIEDSLSPDGTTVEVTSRSWKCPKADKVKFIRDVGYEVTTEYDNPAGLKLSYTSKTGLFKGSFKLYSTTESDRSKKRTVTVIGAVVDGVAYGSAYIKKVGAVPVMMDVQ